MRIASIDIGTNSVLLLVVEKNPDGSLVRLDETCTITRLGQGVGQRGRLDPAAIERTLNCLKHVAEKMDNLAVERRHAVGTAVLRDVDNGDEFINKTNEILGVSLETVSGLREAELVVAGVRGSLGELADGTVLFDIGGGSSEFVLWRDGSVAALCSLALGAVRLTERCLRNDPPSPADLSRLQATIAEILEQLPDAFPQSAPLFGTAGTVTTLATVQLGLVEYDTQAVNGLRFSATQLAEQVRRYAETNLEDRQKIKGLDKKRADIILAGSLAVQAIMNRFGAGSLRVCDRGVRWGVIQQMAGRA